MPETQPTRGRLGLFGWLMILLVILALLGATLLALGASPPYNTPWSPPPRFTVEEPSLL